MIRLRAPAKLNLYLRVLGKRPDGYHEIETVFERVDLADELTFEPQASRLRLTCSEPSLSCGADNLVIQAARALRQAGRTRRGARIHLAKRIPIAAGLGGGSSDAATTLRGLNQLWELKLGPERLLELAAQLGSDVACFLPETPFALGRGRGEVCEPVDARLRLFHVLVCPDARLSTEQVYAGGRFDLTAPKPSITMVVHALRNGSLGELADGLWNDLEPEAIRRCPIIGLIQSHLRTVGCLSTRVTGSGPAVFGLCRDATHAHDVAERMRALSPSAWRIDVSQTARDHVPETRRIG